MNEPKKGDRVRYSVRDKDMEPRVGIVEKLLDDDGIPTVFIRGEDWEFGHHLNVTAFDPEAADEVFTAEIIKEDE